MNKKIIIIVSVIAMIIVSILIYYFYKGSNKLNISNHLIAEKVLDKRVYFPGIYNGTINYLSDFGINFYQYNIKDKTDRKIYDQEFLDVQKIQYDKQGKFAVIYSNYPDRQITTLDISSQKTYQLNSSVESVVFSNNDNKIYYIFNKEGICSLNYADIDGKNWNSIFDVDCFTDGYDLTLIGDYLYFTNLNKVFSIDIKDKKIKNTIIDKELESFPLYFNSGTKIAFNEGGQDKTSVLDINQKNIIKLKEKIDLSKAIFYDDKNIIYYTSTNNLKIINLTNNSINEYTVDDSKLDRTNMLDDNISNLFIDQNNNLYFNYNYHLYSIKFKL